MEIKELNKKESSSSLELLFFDKKHSVKLPDEQRAIVKHEDGFLEIAIWFSEDKKWYSEGSLVSSGGIGGNITNEVSEFAIIE